MIGNVCGRSRKLQKSNKTALQHPGKEVNHWHLTYSPFEPDEARNKYGITSLVRFATWMDKLEGMD